MPAFHWAPERMKMSFRPPSRNPGPGDDVSTATGLDSRFRGNDTNGRSSAESLMSIAIDAIRYEKGLSAVVREPHHERTGAPLALRLSKGERHFRGIVARKATS